MEAGIKRLRDNLPQEGEPQMEKKPRKEEPIQIHTAKKREPPRNFLEVMVRTKLEREPKFTVETREQDKTPVRTPVRKRIQRFEERLESH